MRPLISGLRLRIHNSLVVLLEYYQRNYQRITAETTRLNTLIHFLLKNSSSYDANDANHDANENVVDNVIDNVIDNVVVIGVEIGADIGVEIRQKARWRAAALHRKKCYFVLLRVFRNPLNKAIFRHDHAFSDVKRRKVLAPKEIVSIRAGNTQDCGDVTCS